MILSGPILQILHPRTCITCFLVKWSGTCHCHSFTNGKCVNMWGSSHFSIRKPGMLYFGLACVKTKRQTERFSSDLIPKYQQWLGIPLALKWGARTQNPGLLCEWPRVCLSSKLDSCRQGYRQSSTGACPGPPPPACIPHVMPTRTQKQEPWFFFMWFVFV